MIINGDTEIREHPKKNRHIEETNTFVAEYELFVGDESTGVIKTVVSKGKVVKVGYQAGGKIHTNILDGLNAAGHTVTIG